MAEYRLRSKAAQAAKEHSGAAAIQRLICKKTGRKDVKTGS